MIECLIYLILYCIVAIIVLYVIETLLALFVVLPPPVPILLRLLGALLVLLALLQCLGLLSGHGRLGKL
jgi:hypothetical protein